MRLNYQIWPANWISRVLLKLSGLLITWIPLNQPVWCGMIRLSFSSWAQQIVRCSSPNKSPWVSSIGYLWVTVSRVPSFGHIPSLDKPKTRWFCKNILGHVTRLGAHKSQYSETGEPRSYALSFSIPNQMIGCQTQISAKISNHYSQCIHSYWQCQLPSISYLISHIAVNVI